MPASQDIAIGSYEAAAILGVHFTRPRRMMDRGEIVGKLLDAGVRSPTRRVAVYSLASCEENFSEYEEAISVSRGRPRLYADDRKAAIKRLAAEKTRIAYDDAIGIAEAATILGCHLSLIPHLIGRNMIVTRQPWNRRAGSAKYYICSRKSVEAFRKTRK